MPQSGTGLVTSRWDQREPNVRQRPQQKLGDVKENVGQRHVRGGSVYTADMRAAVPALHVNKLSCSEMVAHLLIFSCRTSGSSSA